MRRLLAGFLLVFVYANFGFAQEKASPSNPRFVEGKSGKGELKYVQGVPVLVVEGTPEEIGTQFGELALKPTKKPLLDRVELYAEKVGWKSIFPIMVKTGGLVFPFFPRENQKEINTAAKVAGVDKDLLATLNAIPDLQKLGGCSTFLVEPERSKTGQPLFGRILDWAPYLELPEYTLVTVFRAQDKRPCAVVTFPMLFGALSGMNDAGLCLAINEITVSKDGSSAKNITGTPMMLLFRKILQECATVEEAEKMLVAADRTTYFCLTVCDTKGGCVFEVTPKNVVARRGEKNVCCCTNHFRTNELSVSKVCGRYEKLQKAQLDGTKFGVEEVAKQLDAVSQQEFTVQAMVFEPSERVLHLSYGGGKSATEKPLTKLDLKPYFAKDRK